jgi:hypothetical protein
MPGHMHNKIMTSCTLLLTVLLSGQFVVNARPFGKKEDKAMSYIQEEVWRFLLDLPCIGLYIPSYG